MRGNKGFADLVIIAGLALAVLLGFVAQPILSKIVPQTKNTQSKDARTRVEQPVYAVNEVTGEVKTIGTAKWDIMNSQDLAEQPKLSLWEKLQNLGIWAIILIIIGLACPLTAPFLIKGFFNLKNSVATIKTEKDDLETDTKKIVLSMEKALEKITDPVLKQQMLDAMSKVQDSSTKTLVSQLKQI